MKKALKLQEHKHTAKIMHHKHTSYRALFLLMMVFGLSLLLIGKSASAADYVLNARVAAPLPTVAPKITTPAPNSTVSNPNIVISGTCPIIEPAIVVVLYRGDTMLGSAGCSSAGKFLGSFSLIEGNNIITPKLVTITTDAGPVGESVNIAYVKPSDTSPSPTSSSTKNSSVQPSATPTQTAVKPSDLQIVSAAPLIIYRQNQSIVWKINVDGGQTPYTIMVDWGDGTKETFVVASAGEQALEHTYTKAINTVVRASAKDATGREVYTSVAGVSIGAAQNPEVYGASKQAQNKSLPLVQVWLIFGLTLALLFLMWLRHQHLQKSQAKQPKKTLATKSKTKRKTNKPGKS